MIRRDALLGGCLGMLMVLVALEEWSGEALFDTLAAVMAVPVLALLVPGQRPARLAFLAVGSGLIVMAALTLGGWQAATGAALAKAAFIAAFFSALATLRSAAGTSRAIEACGRYLATQPPGRRYAALTLGGHLFGMLLNYGAIALLGTLAEASAAREPNAEIRGHRIRRMLLAIQRGFLSTLTWSPLAFAVAISTALVPGASWADAVGLCLVSAAILAGTGWALDTAFKPRLSTPPPPRSAPEGDWTMLWPLVALLAIIATAIGAVNAILGVSAVGTVMALVPLLSAAWIFVQSGHDGGAREMARRIGHYAAVELPGYRGELLLLMMAGFIGTLGSALLAPLIDKAGIDLGAVAGWQVMLALVWIIPLTGQLGMNPILSVSLMAPLLPPAADLGLTPTDLIVAITAGWALSGASSPFTATTLLIGAIGKVSAHHVGLVWNGAYTIVAGVALSVWIVLVAAF